jgi:hypothetical protein
MHLVPLRNWYFCLGIEGARRRRHLEEREALAIISGSHQTLGLRASPAIYRSLAQMDDATPIMCAGCEERLHLSDIVVVTTEIPPSWATHASRTMTIAHQGCESRTSGDHNWSRESPQTLLHALRTLADGGSDRQSEPSRILSNGTSG